MEKIKEFFKQFYSNKKLFWGVVGGAAALLVILGVVLALVLGGNHALTNCTITVKTEGGMALEGVAVSVYADEAKTEMVTYAKTDAEGKISVEEIPAGSIAVVEGLAAGYVAEESYAITQQNTEIVVTIELLKEMSPITLGGVMFDFTVTDTDGVSYTLSELLKEKDAVVLNLWFTNCGPCKTEFPYLQKAYDKYSDKIALLALDPVADDNEAAVAAFKTANALTFPMAKVDAAWEQQIEGIAYPTTVVIDRFGTVALLHVGGINTVGVFEGVFEHFTAEDYTQCAVADINTLKIEVEAGAGTKENPMEFTGVEEFEVTVEAGETVYCNLYRVFGKELTVASETVKVLYGEQEYLPVEGVVTCLVNVANPSTPALVAFTNTGSAAETYKVTLVPVEGSMEKPFALELGEFTADVVQGNSQGVFYAYTAEKTGDFTIALKKAPEDVQYALALNNITAGKYLTLEEDGEKDSNGNMLLTVEANRGDELQVIVSVLPDDTGAYKAAAFELQAAFEPKTTNSDGNGGGNSGGNNSGNGNSGDGSSGNSSGLVNPDTPIEIGGKLRFDAEVKAGTRVYYKIRGVSGTTLCIYDSDAYVIYNGKTYSPNSSGNVFVWVETEDTYSPVEVEIGNSGSSDKTFTVSFYYPEGSKENPYELKLDESFSTALKAGNALGVFYTFKASEAGRLKITLEDAGGIECEINIQNKDTSATILRNLSDSPNGTYTYMDMGANEEVVIWIVAYPDSSFNYPAATVVAKATFE